jgi:cell division protease FtsH
MVIQRHTVRCRVLPVAPLAPPPLIHTAFPMTREVAQLPGAPAIHEIHEWSYSGFMKTVEEGKISKVRMFQDRDVLQASTMDGIEGQVTLPPGNKEILDSLLKHHVQVNVEETKQYQMEFLQIVLYVLFFGGLLKIIGGARKGVSGLTNNISKFQEVPETGVTFEDVAGCDSAVEDLKEIVDFLKTPEKYSKLGASIPKGCLLVGSAGCGKTLITRAVAGEAGVPFFSVSASSFLEMFVGVGSSRVRDLFKKARDKAPCIIFIDEIDAIGKSRSSGPLSGGNEEREQTLNQILIEMDGFEKESGVIVLAATNRPEILDDALKRPGRFDRRVHVDLPDYNGRSKILAIHTKNKPLHETTNLDDIARMTAGFSGADLKNLANEAAIFAAREDASSILPGHFSEAFDKVVLGAEKKTLLVSEEKRRLVAVHESGHAIAAMAVRDYDPISKVTILPRGNSGGVTMFQPSMERIDNGLVTREHLENQLVVALGGRVAEELVFGKTNVTTGAQSDIVHVEKVARAMITQFGLSEFFGDIALTRGQYSEQTGYAIDMELRDIVKHAHGLTTDILKHHRGALDALTSALLAKETLSGDEVREIFQRETKGFIKTKKSLVET